MKLNTHTCDKIKNFFFFLIYKILKRKINQFELKNQLELKKKNSVKFMKKIYK